MSTEKPVQAPPFKFRILPVFATVLLGFGLPWLAGETVDFLRHYSHLVPPMADKLGRDYAEYAGLLAFAVIAIWAMKWLAPADNGLHLPQGKSHLRDAVLWGLLLGVLMMIVDNAPCILTQTAPKLGREMTTVGRLGFQGVFAGSVEEIFFRSLLVTYLTVAMPGKMHIRGYEMNVAGVVVAVVYALYVVDFVHQPFAIALGQMFLGFVAGVLYAYWLEKSKSVVAPIVGHNIAGAVEWALLLLIVTSWA